MNAMDMENTNATTAAPAAPVATTDTTFTPGKDYLLWEKQRNQTNRKLYTDIIAECFGRDGIVIGHHLEFYGNSDNPEEIPAADTLVFDHHIMTHLFGAEAINVMVACAKEPAETRDSILANAFYCWRRVNTMATNLNPARAGAIAAGFKGSNPAEQGAIAAATDGWSTSVKAD